MTAKIQEIADQAENESQGMLRSLVNRIENVEGELDELRDDRKSIYAEAKASGFNTKALRHCVALRRRSADEKLKADDLEAVIATYAKQLELAL